MAQYFDKFPLIPYDINKTGISNFQVVTNIFFRIQVLKEVLNNITSYYAYVINDEDTPEILAEKIYGTPEAHWVILLANNIIDPQYEWPLKPDAFNKYIVKKYGSVANAKNQIHHYEKLVGREVNESGVVTVDRYTINYTVESDGILVIGSSNGDFSIGESVSQNGGSFTGIVSSWSNVSNTLTLANTTGSLIPLFTISGNTSNVSGVVNSVSSEPDAPYDYYLGMAAEQDVSTINVAGKTVVEVVARSQISCYDYEDGLNQQRRLIKIIKPEYYGQIVEEFRKLTNSNPAFLRRLV